MTLWEDYSSEGFLITGILFFSAGIIYHLLRPDLNIGAILITIGIGFITIGLAGFTSRLLKRIAYSLFEETLADLIDMRLTMRDKFFKIKLKLNRAHIVNETYTNREKALDLDDYSRYVSFSIWKALIYLRRANIFSRYYRPRDKEGLINFVDNFFIDIAEGKKNYQKPLTEADKRHVLSIFNRISQIDIFNDNQDKANAIRDNLAYIRNGIRGFQNR